jgi:hypothetical protein
MTFSLPPAARLAEALNRDIILAASKFRRDHRYTFGADLRACAWQVLVIANQAAAKPEARAALVVSLVDQVDELKLRLQLGHKLRMFASFGQFESLMRSASELGQQIGGWHKHLHPKGQNGQPVKASQRAKTLSTRTASIVEANS